MDMDGGPARRRRDAVHPATPRFFLLHHLSGILPPNPHLSVVVDQSHEQAMRYQVQDQAPQNRRRHHYCRRVVDDRRRQVVDM
jgi:hypothetical protein